MALAAAAISRLRAREAAARAAAQHSDDPYSPWAALSRLAAQRRSVARISSSATLPKTARFRPWLAGQRWLLQIGEQAVFAHGEQRPDGAFAITIDGIRRQVTVLGYGAETSVFIDGESWLLVEIDPLAARRARIRRAGG